LKIRPECITCILSVRIRELEKYLDRDRALKASIELLKRLYEDMIRTEEVTVIASNVFRFVKTVTGVGNPYSEEKRRATEVVLKALGKVEEYVSSAESPVEALRRALRASVAANAIDFGVAGYSFEAEKVVDEVLRALLAIDDTDRFAEYIRGFSRPRIVYLLDNSGEAVLDALVSRILRKHFNAEVYAVAKSAPFQNDVTVDDLKSSGLDSEFTSVVGTGGDGSSVFLWEVSDEVKKLLFGADAVIAKGMANYEYLYFEPGVPKPKLFALKAKCRVIAESLGVNIGDYVIKFVER